MISFPIVDTHVHLWDPRVIHYPWTSGSPLFNRPYLLEDFRAACGPVDVASMVFVECDCDPADAMKEAQWVDQLATEEPRIQAIVAAVRLEDRNKAPQQLEGLSGIPRVRGVRRLIQAEPDGFCLRPEFIDGVRSLEQHGFHFELGITHRQLRDTVELVSRCPNIRFMLDHIGKPNIREHVYEPWKSELKALSELPNVWCKLSGLVTEADHSAWTKEDLKPYIDHTLDCFGFDRTMYGSDWPVARQATEYVRWVETIEWVLKDCSKDNIERLFRKSAAAFYRLPVN